MAKPGVYVPAAVAGLAFRRISGHLLTPPSPRPLSCQALAITSKTPGVAVGSKVSIADITIYYWLTFFFDNVEGAKAAYSTCPTIGAVVSTTGALDKVKEWESKRPATKM